MTMSKNNEIVKLINDAYPDFPISYLSYDGSKDKYFTFNFPEEYPNSFADDNPQIEIYSLQLHFFAPAGFNHLAIKDEVKKLLFENGWLYPSTYVMYESDTKYHHIVWSTEKEQFLNG